MRKRRQGRNPLLAKRWFADDIIITCVRWYLKFRLSYRDLSCLAAELGIAVAPSTILRWVVRHAEQFARRWEPFELPVGRSWRADETYVKVNGGWMYLYRAVDERGRTVASYLSRKRDRAGVRIFFRLALKRHGEPRSIGETRDFTRRWSCSTILFKYWQDRIFNGLAPRKLNSFRIPIRRRAEWLGSNPSKVMLGFKRFQHARRVLAGIELIHKLKKGHYGVPFRFGTTSRQIWRRVLAS